jgi:hypothetical protein
MMKMLETQVGQLVGRLTNDEGKLPGQPKGPKSAKAIQTRTGKEIEDPERPAGARKPKPSTEAEGIAKEKVTRIVTEEPEFEMPEEDTRIPQLKQRYFRGKLDNHLEMFVEVVRRLSINMPLLDALQVPTYSRYFKDILANNYEIATLGVDHVKMSEECSAAIANGLEKQKDPVPYNSVFRWFIQFREGVVGPWSKCERHAKRCVREATPTIGAYGYVFGVGR